ncbi:MAG: DUF393 domain-containing protein [Candidatus Omnitrophica bacterium]|nr:DUF393 domain-containing protein [Candidatus Omnitrophota bacterium]
MPYYLLYDEECALCVRFQAGIKERDRKDLIVPVGFTDPRIHEIVPQLSNEQLLNNFHLVAPDGRVASGGNALPELLCLLPGLRFLGLTLKVLPPARRLSDRIYRRIAARRKEG